MIKRFHTMRKVVSGLIIGLGNLPQTVHMKDQVLISGQMKSLECVARNQIRSAHIDETMGNALQNTIYNKDGDVVGCVDFRKHNRGADPLNPRSTSGHGYVFPQPGQPASGHGPNSPHIPNKSLPSGWDALPPGVKPQTPIGH